MRTRDRERRRSAALATIERRPLLVDGEPRQFEVARAGDWWAAVGRCGGVLLTITGRGIDPTELRLEPVVDPMRTLL